MGGPEKTCAAFQKVDARLRAAGLPPMHWNAMVGSPAQSAAAKEAGFHSTGRYNVASARKVREDGTEDYADVMEAHRAHWKNMLSATL